MLEDKRFFDLQLFNVDDGATDDSDTLDTEDTADTGSEDENYEFVIDENGNFVIQDLTVDNDDDDDDTDDNEDNDDSGNEDLSDDKQPPAEDKYKVKVDGVEQEVTLNELLNGYMRQSDYTKKTQALAQDRQRIQQALNPEQLNNETQGQEQVNPQKAFYESIATTAKEAVAQDFGEEFDPYNEVHLAALAIKTQEITNNLTTRFQTQNAIKNFEIEARSKEPEHYDAIYEYAREKVDYLPYRERIALEQAFSQGDVKVMDKFFQDMRKEYYNSKGIVIPGEPVKPEPKPIIKKRPPVVEGGGSGSQTLKKSNDPRSLGKLNTDQQAQWLIDMGLV